MANFLNYRNINFYIENQHYYASRVSLSAQSSVAAVILNDGSLLNYAPQGAVVGSLSCDFYLTGSLPSYLNITGTSETAITTQFAGVSITGVYPKSINFSVEPFQPILISAEFDWYGNVNVNNFIENTEAQRNSVEVPTYISNGYKSYITTNGMDNLGYIVNFDYSLNSDRPAYFHADDKYPFRVGKLNKTANLSLKSNKLGSLIDITGKYANTTITLSDLYGTVLNTFNISGVLTNQSYEISEGQYMLTSASITQTVTEKKVLI